jgi:hypothetical protein
MGRENKKYQIENIKLKMLKYIHFYKKIIFIGRSKYNLY